MLYVTILGLASLVNRLWAIANLNCIQRAHDALKGLTMGGTMFEALGLSYVGPIDGHDLDQLLPVLRTLKARATGPVLLHVLTRKGKGYAPAETARDRGHATGRFDVLTGEQVRAKSNAPSYTSASGCGRCWRRSSRRGRNETERRRHREGTGQRTSAPN